MADQDEKAVEEKLAARKVHFETLFDDFQGKISLKGVIQSKKTFDMCYQTQGEPHRHQQN
jgi:hypothetical protein